MTMIQSVLRTVIVYLALIGCVRLMGKRQIGQMEPSEFVVTMLVANLASLPMEEPDMPLMAGLVPIGTVLILELLLSVGALRSLLLRKILCGKPMILIENGKILAKNLRRTRITLDELTGHLRLKDVLDLKAVQFAILETDGNLSVFPYPKHRPANASEAGIPAKPQYLPITIIGDGHLYRDNLQLLGKDEAWVNRVLSERSATIATTWLLTCDKADQICFYPKEASQ